MDSLFHPVAVGLGAAPSVDGGVSGFYPFGEGVSPSLFFLCIFEPSFSHPTGISWVPGRWHFIFRGILPFPEWSQSSEAEGGRSEISRLPPWWP